MSRGLHLCGKAKVVDTVRSMCAEFQLTSFASVSRGIWGPEGWGGWIFVNDAFHLVAAVPSSGAAALHDDSG